MNCSFPVFISCKEANSAARDLLQRITEERPLFKEFQKEVGECVDLQSLSDQKIETLAMEQAELNAKRDGYSMTLNALVQAGSISPDLDRKIKQISSRLIKLDTILQDSETHVALLADPLLDTLRQDTSLFKIFQNAMNTWAHPEGEIPYLPYETRLNMTRQHDILTQKRACYEEKLIPLRMLHANFSALEHKMLEINEYLMQIDEILHDAVRQIPSLVECGLPRSFTEVASGFMKTKEHNKPAVIEELLC